MVYVSSDLHGCNPVEFRKLLDRAGFGPEDFLFVLGDVIDRGEYGAQLLLWLTQQPNMQLILGNHEAMMLACAFVFDEVSPQRLERITGEELMMLESWWDNGGGPTMVGFRRLLRKDPDLVRGILDYLRDAPLYETLEVNGRKYVLVHAGLDNFDPARPLPEYGPEELLFVRPDLQTRYYADTTVVFGHTPTEYYGARYRGKAIVTETWINIDTGAANGHSPMLLRLDDGKAFY